jgi:hypothetical protein
MVCRARVLRELGFEMDFVDSVRLGISGEAPDLAELARIRRSSGAGFDWVRDVCVPAARFGGVALITRLVQVDGTLRPEVLFECALAAAAEGRAEVVRQLVGRGAPLSMHGADEIRSLLHAAAESDDPELIHWLLQHGAELELLDHDGCTALHVAAHKCTTRAVDALTAAGADVNARNDHGETPLHDVASLGLDTPTKRRRDVYVT